MYSLMYRNLDINPWARNVKTILQSTGLYEAWVNPSLVGNVNVFISLVKQRVFDMFVQNCMLI